MEDTAKKLRDLKAEERAIDDRIRKAVEQSAIRPPLRNPADGMRDRRQKQGRTR